MPLLGDDLPLKAISRAIEIELFHVLRDPFVPEEVHAKSGVLG